MCGVHGCSVLYTREGCPGNPLNLDRQSAPVNAPKRESTRPLALSGCSPAQARAIRTEPATSYGLGTTGRALPARATSTARARLYTRVPPGARKEGATAALSPDGHEKTTRDPKGRATAELRPPWRLFRPSSTEAFRYPVGRPPGRQPTQAPQGRLGRSAKTPAIPAFGSCRTARATVSCGTSAKSAQSR